MKKFLKGWRKFIKVVLGILLFLFTLLWLFCAYMFWYNIRDPHVMGNDSTFLKMYSQYFPKAFEKKMEVQSYPFSSYYPTLEGEMIPITSGTTLSFTEPKNYNLVIDTLKINTMPLQMKDIPELRFSNVSLPLPHFLYYNPDYTSRFDPYPYIDYIYYGLRPKRMDTEGQGDFCLVLSASNVITHSLISKFPDCHIIVIPKTWDYPYAILQAGVAPLDSSFPATIEVVYHTFEDVNVTIETLPL